eukprot:tig00021036_g17318.t1
MEPALEGPADSDGLRPATIGRALLQEEGGESVLHAPPDPDFVTTENPVDMRLSAAANISSGPEDPTAVFSADAERYESNWVLDREATLAALDPESRATLEALSAMREGHILQFAQLQSLNESGARSYNGPNGTIIIDRSVGGCPPDRKVAGTLGRNTLPALASCPATPDQTSTAPAAGFDVALCSIIVPMANAVQVSLKIAKTGLYRFRADDETANSAKSVVIDLRSDGSCAPLACNRPTPGGATELWAILYENSTVNVNVAVVASNATSTVCPPSDAVVLDISLETPYDERVFVDESLGEVGFNPEDPLRDPDTLDLYFTDLDAALRYAYNRTLTAGSGTPLQARPRAAVAALSLMLSSVNGTWDLPASPSAAGARIWGTNSAEDTLLTCGGLGQAITLSHASPLVSFLGVSIAACGTAESSFRADERLSGAAISVVGLKNIVFKHIVFVRNGNHNASVDGRGGAVALLGGASATFDGCIFVQNTARRGGGAVAILDGSEASFTDTLFASNAAPVGGAVLVSGARTASFSVTAFHNNSALPGPPDSPEEDAGWDAALEFKDPSDVKNWMGGAVAILGATETVQFDVAIFESNSALFGAAIATASRVSVTRSQLSGSRKNSQSGPAGGAIWVHSTEARIELTQFDGNEQALPLAAGGITCSGAGASLSVYASTFADNWGMFGGAARVFHGCRANFTLCSFTDNVALAGGAVMVGQMDAAAGGAQAASTWAMFDQVEFRRNYAGFPAEEEATEYGLDPTTGWGGALAIFAPVDGAVPISGCLLAENHAAAGGGLFANTSVSIDGDTIFYDNHAGFPYFDGHAERDVQIGGGALLSHAAASSRIAGALFAKNTARGAFGGGLALLGGTVDLRGPRFLQNSVLGLFGDGVAFVGEPSFIASNNVADGPFHNVYLMSTGGNSSAGGGGAADGARGVAKSCSACSLCQTCEIATGRCKFPADFDAWCEFIGGCTPEACPFVSAGTARFDESNGLRSIRVELDSTSGLSTGGSGNCSALFVEDTIKMLGEGATCTLSSASGAGRRRRQALQTSAGLLIVQLGKAFSVEPGAVLGLRLEILPERFRSVSNEATSIPVQQMKEQLARTNRTITAELEQRFASFQAPLLISSSSPSGISSAAVVATAACALLAAAALLFGRL